MVFFKVEINFIMVSGYDGKIDYKYFWVMVKLNSVNDLFINVIDNKMIVNLFYMKLCSCF